MLMPLENWLATCFWSPPWNECEATGPCSFLQVGWDRAALVRFACQTLWPHFGLCWEKSFREHRTTTWPGLVYFGSETGFGWNGTDRNEPTKLTHYFYKKKKCWLPEKLDSSPVLLLVLSYFLSAETRGQPNTIPTALCPQPVRMLPNSSSQDSGQACGPGCLCTCTWARYDNTF